MPWPIAWTIWLYVICGIGVVVGYIYYEKKAH